MKSFSDKYHRWYHRLVESALVKNRKKGGDEYFESHHIVPKSLGGSNTVDNKVLFTAREHFVAHLLLTRMYTGDSRKKMVWALHRMAFSNGRLLKPHEYEMARREHSKSMSQPKSEETKEKMRKPKSEAHKAHMREHHAAHPRTVSKEQREKQSLTFKEYYRTHPGSFVGKNHTEETKEKLRQANLGKKHSEETLARMRESRSGSGNAMYGKTHSEETRAKLKAAWVRRRARKLAALAEQTI